MRNAYLDLTLGEVEIQIQNQSNFEGYKSSNKSIWGKFHCQLLIRSHLILNKCLISILSDFLSASRWCFVPRCY